MKELEEYEQPLVKVIEMETEGVIAEPSDTSQPFDEKPYEW